MLPRRSKTTSLGFLCCDVAFYSGPELEALLSNCSIPKTKNFQFFVGKCCHVSRNIQSQLLFFDERLGMAGMHVL